MEKHLTSPVLTIFLVVLQVAASQNGDIDAFDQRICGKSALGSWQLAESAYNCKHGRLYSTGDERTSNCSPRISDGLDANDGEFPSAVLFIVVLNSGIVIQCGGTLIHSNLVITVAHCLEGATKVTIHFGSNNIHAQEEVEAIGWCQHRLYSPTNPKIIYDLGMIKLARNLDYIPGKLQPACLRLDIAHDSRAVCSHVGFGFFKNNTMTDRLKTIALARKCDHHNEKPSATCYARPKSIDDIGHACPGDSGSGLYCFDSCDGYGQHSFVVGALTGGTAAFCIPGQGGIQWFADFNGMPEAVREMIGILLHGRDVSKHKCVSLKRRNAHQNRRIELYHLD